MTDFGQPERGQRSKNEERCGHYFVPDSLLLTIETFGWEPTLADGSAAHVLLVALSETWRRAPFDSIAYVILPDHAHLLLKPGEQANADRIVRVLTGRFERDYRQMMGLPTSERLLQRSYQMRRADDEGAFTRFLDFVHYDPVHHGVAERPEEWPHSSYQRWVEQGVYKLGWGWDRPESLERRRIHRG